jgi:hypothetical protein
MASINDKTETVPVADRGVVFPLISAIFVSKFLNVISSKQVLQDCQKFNIGYTLEGCRSSSVLRHSDNSPEMSVWIKR